MLRILLVCFFASFQLVAKAREVVNTANINKNSTPQHLTCEETFRTYDCQKKIDEAGPSNRSDFIDCSAQTPSRLKQIGSCSTNLAIGAGFGYLSMAAPQVALPIVGGLVTYNALKSEEECFYDFEKKLKIARPLAAIHNQQYAEIVAKRLSCIDLNKLVLETTRNHLGRIFEKQLNQERYEKEVARRPNRKDSLQRIYPESKRVLTPEEQALLSVMNEIKEEENTLFP